MTGHSELLMEERLNSRAFDQLSKSSPSALHPSLNSRRARSQARTPQHHRAVSARQLQQQNKPANLSHVPCKFFKQGTCTAGANCLFSHSQSLTNESAVCKYFLRGNCKFGSKCALLHTLSPENSGNNPKHRQIVTAVSPSNDNSNNTANADLLPSPPRDSQLTAALRRDHHLLPKHSPTSSFFAASAPAANEGADHLGHLLSPPWIFEEEEQGDRDEGPPFLPSSLNDLLTPAELRRAGIGQSSFLRPSAHRNSTGVSSLLGSSPNEFILSTSSKAINIPSGDGQDNGRRHRRSRFLGGLFPETSEDENDDDINPPFSPFAADDDMQFFMQDDEDSMICRPDNSALAMPVTPPSSATIFPSLLARQ
ncbi:hypothetical protein BCR43DRAFT_482570 [Syncephalastrum racemosum]|uniref:C3H1-type domain-containing protein n=1 Tax=Syncephalastrum racemosum TaxID=13706 RepID=A0A1X2HTZ2_SYNRA|nr:hypothetical protein BCR43DRAFT_482570 [Syncephalastrum racemosum]